MKSIKKKYIDLIKEMVYYNDLWRWKQTESKPRVCWGGGVNVLR